MSQSKNTTIERVKNLKAGDRVRLLCIVDRYELINLSVMPIRRILVKNQILDGIIEDYAPNASSIIIQTEDVRYYLITVKDFENFKLLNSRSIQSKLEDTIFSFVANHNRGVEHIVMHPDTWEEVLKEIISSNGSSYHKSTENMKDIKYKGIRVVRSTDVEKFKFLI